jgi:hypothetical protein
MSTTEQRLAANRANAQFSTGPISDEGKSIASRNATRHGLLSSRLLLDDESPDEFDQLLSDLCDCLRPVGLVEATLVERIAVAIWRQRRLVQAETANLALGRLPRKVASMVSSEMGRVLSGEIKADHLAPFDADREQWCRATLAEAEALEKIDLATIEASAPSVLGQLQEDAAEDNDTVEKFIADYKGGLIGYLGELMLWCREQLRSAEARPTVLALAAEVRTKRLIMSSDDLELLARYQSTLDNQLYKALRALREAQEWRLKAIDASPALPDADAVEPAQAA